MLKRHALLYMMSFGLGLMFTALASCSTNTVYYSFDHTPIAGWEKNDTLLFDVPRLARGGTYEQLLGLRMTGDFPFTSVSLIFEQTVLPHGKVYTDTVKCQITDSRGNFLGDGISAYQYTFPVRQLSLSKGDSIHICVRHNMKREILPGVSDVGIEMNLKQ